MTKREHILAVIIVCLLVVTLCAPLCSDTVYKYFAGLRVGSGAPSTGAINLASGTATSAGIAFGSDAVLYRDSSARIANSAKTYCMDDVVLGSANTKTITCTARLILRTVASDPLDGTAGNRPAGSVGEIAIYSGGVYLCTNASTPTWVKVGPAG